jgi:hypothetical protein
VASTASLFAYACLSSRRQAGPSAAGYNHWALGFSLIQNGQLNILLSSAMALSIEKRLSRTPFTYSDGLAGRLMDLPKADRFLGGVIYLLLGTVGVSVLRML